MLNVQVNFQHVSEEYENSPLTDQNIRFWKLNYNVVRLNVLLDSDNSR